MVSPAGGKQPQMVLPGWECNDFLIKHSEILPKREGEGILSVSPGPVEIFLSIYTFLTSCMRRDRPLHGDRFAEGTAWENPFSLPSPHPQPLPSCVCLCQWHPLGCLLLYLSLSILARLFRTILFCDPLLPTCHRPSRSTLRLNKLPLLQTLGWNANFCGEDLKRFFREKKPKDTKIEPSLYLGNALTQESESSLLDISESST